LAFFPDLGLVFHVVATEHICPVLPDILWIKPSVKSGDRTRLYFVVLCVLVCSSFFGALLSCVSYLSRFLSLSVKQLSAKPASKNLKPPGKRSKLCLLTVAEERHVVVNMGQLICCVVLQFAVMKMHQVFLHYCT